MSSGCHRDVIGCHRSVIDLISLISVGPTIFANGIALCDDCNGTQGVKFLDDWVKEEGFELSDLGERQVGRFIRFKEWWAAQNHPALECVGRDHPRSARRMQGVKDFIPVF